MSMPQDERTPGADIVDVLSPIHIIDLAPLAPFNEEGGSAYGLERSHRAINSTWQIALRFLEKFF
jgi:hypothetical protein